eukprot:scaffold94812_cov15-Tisochrysis_lutea.AAC.1
MGCVPRSVPGWLNLREWMDNLYLGVWGWPWPKSADCGNHTFVKCVHQGKKLKRNPLPQCNLDSRLQACLFPPQRGMRALIALRAAGLPNCGMRAFLIRRYAARS